MKNIKQILQRLSGVLILLVLSVTGFGQDYPDDPNLDQVPQWYIDQTQSTTPRASQVITTDYYDEFYLGVDLAECHISVNPQEPEQFFTAFNISHAHHTMDGYNWVENNPVWGTTIRGDVLTAYDSLGNLYYENMYGGGSIMGCKVVTSTDNGQTWSAAVNAISGNDKNWLAADQTAGPYANSVYSVMTNSGSGNFSRSTDYGVTWNNTATFSTQSLPGMMVCVGAQDNVQGGAVYVVTNSGSAFASTYTFYRSTNGGTNFSLMSAQYFSGYVGVNSNGRNSVENMRTRPYPFIAADNSYGPFRGRLYCVYASNDPPGNGNKPDIWCRYSDDGGANWSTAKRVNDDLNPETNHQWAPAPWCDKETGRLYIQWMDTRDCPTSDSALMYATYSDNGGALFAANQKVSNQKMKINCNTCGGGGTPRYQGDYNSIVSNSKVSMLSWADFRWGSFASFTAYFPDFALKIYPAVKQIAGQDTVWAVVPGVKLYDDAAIMSASMETPPSGSFNVSMPAGNAVVNFPDSIPILISINNVPEGSYTLTLKGRGPNGTPIHFRESTIEVVPLAPPIAEFTASATNVCAGSTINFTDESQNAPTSWSWSFEGGDPATSTIQNPVDILYDTPGLYDVSLFVENQSGSDEIIKTDYITIKVLPDPPMGEDVSVCEEGLIPSLIVTGDDIIWYDDPELSNIVHEGNEFNTGQTEPGTYTYYATQTVEGCTSMSTEVSLTINALPDVSFDPLDDVCENAGDFELAGGFPIGGEYFGTGVEDDFFYPSVAGTGTHTLGYAYTNENSCTDTAYQEITVNALPVVTCEPFDPVCINTPPFDLSGGMPAGGEYSGNGVIDNMFYPEVAGVGNHPIIYTYTDDETGCSDYAEQALAVNLAPDVSIGNDTSLCGDYTITLDATTPFATSYLWIPGDYTTPTITVDSNGIGLNTQMFKVFVTDQNGCSSADSVDITFIDCTGVDEINALTAVQIYPNPNKGTFTLRISSMVPVVVDIKLLGISGNKYYEKNQLMIDGDHEELITLQQIKAGLYFLIIQNEDGKMLRKILIQ